MASPPPPATVASIDSSEKREAILDAALSLFAERTFNGTPVPLIAERAGVGAGTIYRYFESKEALVNAVYRRWKSELKRRLVDHAPKGATPREEFRHWWRALWSFAQEYPEAFTFLETHHHAAYLDAESRAVGAAINEGARALVRRGQRAGGMRRSDADLLIAMVFGAFTGLVKAGLPASPRVVAETEACAWELVAP
ncbi:MAG: TetR/AcrR family transcriptional regulator [Dehalococcoidia bacterium]